MRGHLICCGFVVLFVVFFVVLSDVLYDRLIRDVCVGAVVEEGRDGAVADERGGLAQLSTPVAPDYSRGGTSAGKCGRKILRPIPGCRCRCSCCSCSAAPVLRPLS